MLLDAIAHEFKTPLTSIKAAATAFLAADGNWTDYQRELITVVDEEADRLSMLVGEAVDMARVEAGNIQIDKQPYAIQELIEAALQQMQSLIRDRVIKTEIDQDLAIVWVDAGLIKLSIRQLLDNAVKYSNPETAIVIKARCEMHGGLRVSVIDQGLGIPKEEQTKIFDRFYRSAATRNSVTGTGMGLAIVQEIMRAHQGAVEVKSAPSSGSEFSLIIPEGKPVEAL